MAVKIPQNIEREDKLVGPLTLRQFLYILGGGAIVFVAYQSYSQGYLFPHEFAIISFLVGGFAASLAFVNINGRPFLIFLGGLVAFIFNPKKRLWNKDNTLTGTPIKIISSSAPSQFITAAQEEIKKSDIEKLALVLDTSGKIKTDEDFPGSHEISTLPQTQSPAPEIMEQELGLEDIFDETDT